MSAPVLKAPFPWFGGKSMAASVIWDRFGDVPNYAEPFFGSGAVLLARPHAPRTETVNDADCYLVNFWRSISSRPEEVARWADWPVTEADQIARHAWLLSQAEFRERMISDPDYCDAKIAGWWVWGQCIWIGDGWCTQRANKIPHLGNAGKGVHRRHLPHLGNAGNAALYEWFNHLQHRLRRVRICCGDWRRVLTPSVTEKHGITGVLLDPPYDSTANQEYSAGTMCAAGVAAWALENADNPLLRIALCGYEGDYSIPESWECVPWVARKGYQKDAEAGHKERIWFSPHCLKPRRGLFSELYEAE